MPKLAESLDERSVRVAREAAEVAQAQQERAQLEAQRRDEAQQTADEKRLQSWDPTALDAAVEQTRREVTEAVEASPIVLALAAHLKAQTRRHLEWADYLGTLQRLGRPTAGAQLPPVADLINPQALIIAAAERIAHDSLADEREAKETETR